MLTRFDPFAELSRMQQEIFQPSRGPAFFRPAVDIFEDAEAITVLAELPGMKQEDVHIELHDGVLSLKGERKLEREEKRESYQRVERVYGTFTRSFAIPDTVDPDRIDAQLRDGVLRLTMQKRPLAKPRKIELS